MMGFFGCGGVTKKQKTKSKCFFMCFVWFGKCFLIEYFFVKPPPLVGFIVGNMENIYTKWPFDSPNEGHLSPFRGHLWVRTRSL